MLQTGSHSRAEKRMRAYPHEMSGGMRQRVMIAMALANEPQLLIADEPTTALDVTIQAQIIALIRQLQTESGMAMILITHDLGVVAEVADEVVVMYAGQVVESGPVDDIFADPQHPYTIGLMGSVPSLGRRQRPPDDNSRHRSARRTHAARVPFLATLPLRRRTLCERPAAPRRDLARSPRSLLVCAARTPSRRLR